MRRFWVQQVTVGPVALSEGPAKHALRVLRLEPGTVVELFDDDGRVGRGPLSEAGVVVVDAVEQTTLPTLVVASAVPKGNRADWMVEKLAEVGVARFVPMVCERSVVTAEGENKIDRWRRLAQEAARQSRRAGTMTVDRAASAADVAAHLASAGVVVACDARGAMPLAEIASVSAVMIGPEGGWTDAEIQRLHDAGVVVARLGGSILRVETAAVVAAAIVLAR